MTKFEDIIERDGMLVYTNVGDSMRPLIKRDMEETEKILMNSGLAN